MLLRTQTDERLVALAREGHERAFEAIVRRYRRQLLTAARRMVPEARAEDVLQQALVSAWGALRRGDEVRDLRAWLYRIVRNAAVSHLRRAEPPELLETLVAAPSPQEEAERRVVVQETLAAVASLPERQREALLRIAVQGDSQDQVADDLGVSKIAVRQLVHRARTSLRAAASAVVPFPVMAWMASAGTGAEPMSLRIAQLITGAGGAGAAATLLKAGAVAGVAATAVSAPILAEHHAPRVRPASVAVTPTATPSPVATQAAQPVAERSPRRRGEDRHGSRSAPSHRGSGRGDDSRSRGGGDDDVRHTSHSGDDGGPDSSGRTGAGPTSGSGDDATRSASGDSSRGSGSSGSGESTSGSPDGGSSGSGDSLSGSGDGGSTSGGGSTFGGDSSGSGDSLTGSAGGGSTSGGGSDDSGGGGSRGGGSGDR